MQFTDQADGSGGYIVSPLTSLATAYRQHLGGDTTRASALSISSAAIPAGLGGFGLFALCSLGVLLLRRQSVP